VVALGGIGGILRRRKHEAVRRRLLAPIRRCVSGDAGFTLVELLMSMSILLFVLGGIMTTLVSATKAQTDLTSRFEAQESARLALQTFKRDVRCADSFDPASGATASVTLTLPAGCSSASGSVTWCVPPGSLALWRIPSGSCTTSVSGSRRWIQNLQSDTLFTPDATAHAGAPISPAVKLDLTVLSGNTKYRLATSVYSRMAPRQ